MLMNFIIFIFVHTRMDGKLTPKPNAEVATITRMEEGEEGDNDEDEDLLKVVRLF